MARQTSNRPPPSRAARPGPDESQREAMKQKAIETVSACTCTKLRKLTRRVTQLYDHFLEPAGLTVTQLGILGHVMASGGDIARGELADMLEMDPTTLTRNLKPLVARGHVTMVRDPSDQRRQGISLTAQGKTTLREAMPNWRKAQAYVTSVVGAGEVARLHEILGRSLVQLADRRADSPAISSKTDESRDDR